MLGDVVVVVGPTTFNVVATTWVHYDSISPRRPLNLWWHAALGRSTVPPGCRVHVTGGEHVRLIGRVLIGGLEDLVTVEGGSSQPEAAVVAAVSKHLRWRASGGLNDPSNLDWALYQLALEWGGAPSP